MDYFNYFKKAVENYLAQQNGPVHYGHHDCVNDGDSEYYYREFWDLWTEVIPEWEEREMNERAQS